MMPTTKTRRTLALLEALVVYRCEERSVTGPRCELTDDHEGPHQAGRLVWRENIVMLPAPSGPYVYHLDPIDEPHVNLVIPPPAPIVFNEDALRRDMAQASAMFDAYPRPWAFADLACWIDLMPLA